MQEDALPSKKGRPKGSKKSIPSIPIMLTLPEPLLVRVEKASISQGSSKQEIVRTAVREWLEGTECSKS